MSRTETPASEDDASVPRELLRTVTPPYGGRIGPEMDVIGWAIFLGILVLLLPLLPVAIALWLIVRLLDRLSGGSE